MLKDVVIANKSYTKLNVSEKDGLDRIALKVMKQDCPDFLLPVRTMEIDGELEIRYELLDGVRLSYSSMKMSKRDFTALLKNMLLPFKTCNDWFLDYHNILLDPNYILIGRNGMSARYIYLPAAAYAQSDKEILEFFSKLVLKMDIMDDSRYTTILLRVLNADNANLISVLDFLTKETEAGTEEKGIPQPLPRTEKPMQPEMMPERKVPSPAGMAERKNSFGIGENRERERNVEKEENGVKEGLGGRPGTGSDHVFGKNNIGNDLLNNLYGTDEDSEERGKAGRREKSEKHRKPQKSEKGAKPEKPEKSEKAGLFKRFKEKSGKEDSDRKDENILAGIDFGRERSAAESRKNSWEERSSAAYDHLPGRQQGNPYDNDDTTTIAGAEEEQDPNILRLFLEEDSGFHCPQILEIDLRKGFATVGRMDKSGNNQSDVNFDSSLTFISRRHFRVEKREEGWGIVDLGSKNGTCVNGDVLVPNMPYPLHPGDKITLSRKERVVYRVG